MRVLIRRPHAYWFLERYPELYESMIRSAPSGAPEGAVVIDGTKAPIPGFVFLSPKGEYEGMVVLQAAEARLELLTAMEKLSTDGR